jgi:hypothetical protein
MSRPPTTTTLTELYSFAIAERAILTSQNDKADFTNTFNYAER